MTEGNDVDRAQATIFERHAQTVMVFILVALLLWVGTTTQETAVAIAKMEVEIAHLNESIDMDENKFTNIEQRLSAIEVQLTSLTNRPDQ